MATKLKDEIIQEVKDKITDKETKIGRTLTDEEERASSMKAIYEAILEVIIDIRDIIEKKP